MQLLKQLFKSLDPTLLQVAATSSRGELQLAFKYESVRELLLVQVVRARQLDARDLRGSSADAYVKVRRRVRQRSSHMIISKWSVAPPIMLTWSIFGFCVDSIF